MTLPRCCGHTRCCASAVTWSPARHPNALLRFVRQKGIDLLVMGVYTRGSMYNVAVGSTTEKILDVMPCDVLVEARQLRGAP